MYLNIIVNALIIFGVIMFFLGAVILNGITKTPDGVELPDKCQSCPSGTCMIKMQNKDTKKETLLEYYKNCEENANANQEKK